MEDLLVALDASISSRAQAARAQPASRHLPIADDRVPDWQAPLTRSEIAAKVEAARVAGQTVKPFVRYSGLVSRELAPVSFLGGQALGQREKERLIQPQRNYNRPKDLRGRLKLPRPGDLPEAGDELCGARHRKWLKAHAAQRERHIHQNYYTLLEQDARREREEERKLQQLALEAVPGGKRMAPARSASCPELQASAPKPIVRHLHPWKVQDKASRILGEAHPWQREAEMREVSAIAATKATAAAAAKHAAMVAAINAKGTQSAPAIALATSSTAKDPSAGGDRSLSLPPPPAPPAGEVGARTSEVKVHWA
eukprot:TRINITY_DN15395_c0_g1_i2.p1 TRINITY_DN15395_c0_g1~~TRINITY_DN15395_c0_g1_i2.p1  ORF type:complete len:312 (-),score=43.62 TRINITY_DN15395_c0_g1_i2:173-1108(-)